jgi:hypothetical protein
MRFTIATLSTLMALVAASPTALVVAPAIEQRTLGGCKGGRLPQCCTSFDGPSYCCDIYKSSFPITWCGATRLDDIALSNHMGLYAHCLNTVIALSGLIGDEPCPVANPRKLCCTFAVSQVTIGEYCELPGK